ncbi:MAG: hypothetical protein EOP48_19505 [Sphingobacteriales bacterium]|nr:MAG: hypothetical protein EOP48_19505 [Sphingobacteriales bacterium]
MRRFFFTTIFFLFTVLTHGQQATKTVIIDGQRFTAHHDQWDFWIIKSKKDTVVRLEPSFMDFKFSDFNKDGYKDLMLDLGGNIPDNYRLLLYVPKQQTFREVKGFDDLPLPLKIAGTKYFYSYSRAGCADETWVSYLFYVKNYKAVKIGYINGEGCGINDGIFIYRLLGDKKKLIKRLPLHTIGDYKDYKWGFLKQYWTKNYQRFLKQD